MASARDFPIATRWARVRFRRMRLVGRRPSGSRRRSRGSRSRGPCRARRPVGRRWHRPAAPARARRSPRPAAACQVLIRRRSGERGFERHGLHSSATRMTGVCAGKGRGGPGAARPGTAGGTRVASPGSARDVPW
jgi:hypothetical protein